MAKAQTLLQMAGADLTPNRFNESVLILIDLQNEYRSGALPLPDVEAATAQAAHLLQRARDVGAPVVHIQHAGATGSLFDVEAARGDFLAEVYPKAGETIIRKTKPNSFAETDLLTVLQDLGRQKLIVAGFMTHMCISATVRAALDLGFWSTVVGNATATRDLPSRDGGIVDARSLQEAELVALSDRFAVIVDNATDIPG